MKVIKRNGKEQPFDLAKIVNAISKAFEATNTHNDKALNRCIKTVQQSLEGVSTIAVEDIQDIVEKALVKNNQYDIAKAYIIYRHDKKANKKFTEMEEQILSVVDGTNDSQRSENANKHLDVNCTVRDYIAGTACKAIAEKILPKKVLEAHKKKWIHFHDMDYSPLQHMHNCSLINVDDMLQNGFQMGDVHIDKPKKFSTACNLMAQINMQVSSAQYGGQTVSWTHLIPFVEGTRNAAREFIDEIVSKLPLPVKILVKPIVALLKNYIIEKITRYDIYTGVKTYQYQTLSGYTANGQTPFVTNVLNLREAESEKDLKDLAVVFEEIFKRRLKGVKDRSGKFVGPLFPKLIYFTCDGLNINEKDPYYYLTKLAAKCIALRMQPDIMSEKKTRKVKSGQVIPCMGSVAPDEVVTYKLNDKILVESIERMWNRLEDINFSYEQAPGLKDRYIKLDGIKIYDNKLKDFTDCTCITKNWADKFIRVKLNDRVLETTYDHKFETENRGEVFGYDLKLGDKILISKEQPNTDKVQIESRLAWLYGVILCDGCYTNSRLVSSFDIKGEDDLCETYISAIEKYFNVSIRTVEQHRGKKGNYVDLISNFDGVEHNNFLIRSFGGLQKAKRHIPTEAFNWNREAKTAFVAGMMDADGYIHIHTGEGFLGSTNKELALQQAKLLQTLGVNAKIRVNFYRGKAQGKIRYSVTFYPTAELVDAMQCKKKTKNFVPVKFFKENDDIQEVLAIETLEKSGWSYDVTTASEHFEVSGVYSHNCRSMLAPVWEDVRYPINTKFHWQLKDGTNKTYTNAPGANFNYDRGFGSFDRIPEDKFQEVIINFGGNSGWVKEIDKERQELIIIRPRVYGRFNCGVVTLNLPHVALTAKKRFEEGGEDDLKFTFYKVLDERLDICHKALLERWKSIQKIKAKNSPILWMHGGITRLPPEASVADYIKSRQNIAQTSISLGYIGLCETCWTIIGESNTTEAGRKFSKDVLTYLNDTLAAWKCNDNLGYAIYGTPEESLTQAASQALQRDFGHLEHITDKDFVINSYHVDPREKIDAFTKLSIEGEYLALSAGGAVSYVETADLTNNPEAIEVLIKHMHNSIMYAEVNRKFGVCYKCGYQGDVPLTKTADGEFVLTCPECGNNDQTQMSVQARLCGYVGEITSNNVNKGRMDDIYNRELHLT